jgi:DNA-binding Lrp family transcriptional regulator
MSDAEWVLQEPCHSEGETYWYASGALIDQREVWSMITAIVLIQSQRGRILELAQELLELPEIAEVYSVAGEYDLVAILRVKEYDAMAEVVPGKLQSLSGVQRTTTLMAFQCYSRHDLERLFSIGFEDEQEEALVEESG